MSGEGWLGRMRCLGIGGEAEGCHVGRVGLFVKVADVAACELVVIVFVGDGRGGAVGCGAVDGVDERGRVHGRGGDLLCVHGLCGLAWR